MSTRPTVLITGASTGIGAVYAERFAQRGHDLVLVARDQARLDALAARLRSEHNVTIDVISADLTQLSDLTTVESRLRDDARIGILVNNAGAALSGNFIDQSTTALRNWSPSTPRRWCVWPAPSPHAWPKQATVQSSTSVRWWVLRRSSACRSTVRPRRLCCSFPKV